MVKMRRDIADVSPQTSYGTEGIKMMGSVGLKYVVARPMTNEPEGQRSIISDSVFLKLCK